MRPNIYRRHLESSVRKHNNLKHRMSIKLDMMRTEKAGQYFKLKTINDLGTLDNTGRTVR